jgi:hypothetical protein
MNLDLKSKKKITLVSTIMFIIVFSVNAFAVYYSSSLSVDSNLYGKARYYDFIRKGEKVDYIVIKATLDCAKNKTIKIKLQKKVNGKWKTINTTDYNSGNKYSVNIRWRNKGTAGTYRYTFHCSPFSLWESDEVAMYNYPK